MNFFNTKGQLTSNRFNHFNLIQTRPHANTNIIPLMHIFTDSIFLFISIFCSCESFQQDALLLFQQKFVPGILNTKSPGGDASDLF